MAQKFGRINPRFKNDHRRIPTNPFKVAPGNKTYEDGKITMDSFLHEADVRTALNIPHNVQNFSECTGNPKWQYIVQPEASEWIYTVLQNQYRMMHYSGDTDGAVPTFGTKGWIRGLNWPVTKEWSQWKTRDSVNGDQVSGYYE